MRFPSFLIGALGAALLAGCGKQATPPAAPAASATNQSAALPVLAKAPDFRLTTLDGQEVTAAGLRGKVVVVDFWATWCGPCIAEIPGYIALQKKYGPQGLVIIGISVDRKGPEHVKAFAAKNGMTYLVAMGDDALAESFGGFDAIPTTFLIDRDGNIRHQKTGSMEHAAYEEIVRRVL